MAIQEFDFSTGKVLDPHRKQSIVLVGDDEDAEVVARGLRTKHYKLLDTTGDIRTALGLVQKHKVGVLFLDADIDGITATDILSKIKSAFPGFNVVLMTATATKELLAEAKTLGAAGFLLKPLTVEAVTNVLSRIK